jgi:lipopolysaccharide transport system permease protein
MDAIGTTEQPLSVASTLREAWSMRRVWWFTATARTRARFARTLFGSFWLGISNLLSIAVLALVYGTVFKVQNFNQYVVYLGLGLVVWNSIAAAIGAAPNLFEHNAQHVHNTNLNPIFYTLEEWAFQVQTFFQSFLLVVLALSFFQGSLVVHLLTASWLPLLNLLLFLYWVPVIVCLLGARYRDVYQLVPIALQLVFLLSPILYEKKNLGALSWTADLNPLYRVLSPLRDSLIEGRLLGWKDALLLVANLLGILLATWLINRERRHLPFLI